MSQIIYSTSFKNFLKNSDCKIARVLYSLSRKRYDPLILTDKEINYITFRTDGTISYLPTGKSHEVSDSGEWKREGRQNGKPSKVIRKLLSSRAQKWFKDSDFECFTNQYKANYSPEGFKFELLDSKEIPNVYCYTRAEGEGSLNNSCMNGDKSYLDIYKGCDKLQILVLKNKEGLLCGRALVWKIDDNITLMDRIYIAQDYYYDLFLSYAKENTWYRKEHYKTYDYKDRFVTPGGDCIRKQFTINTDTDFDYYPYIDTLCYGGDGFLNNYGSGDYTYNNTDGTREGDEDCHDGQTWDDFNDEWIDEDESCYIEDGERQYRGRSTHIDNCVMVGDNWYYHNDDTITQVNGEYYRIDSDEICEIDGDYHLLEDCVYSERDSCYYLQDDCVYCEDDEEDVLRSEAIEIEDKWYHEDSDKIVKIDGDYYLIDSDEIECIDGKYSLKIIA